MSVLMEAKKISKYFGGLKAVDEVDMKINKGEVFGVIGPNGAGKTTFFDVTSGLKPTTSGEIWFDGENITNKKPEHIAKKGLARTFQNIKLFSEMTVLDNVKIGFHMHTKTNMFDAILHDRRYKNDEKMVHDKGMELLDRIGLSQYTDTEAGNLAYGTQRKVEIARALAMEPKILLLDEPAAGMNPQETMSLLEFVKNLNSEGYTIVVIEHDMKFIMNICDRILVLNYGRKICEGTPELIKNDENVCKAYFGSQKVG